LLDNVYGITDGKSLI